ncbi:Gb/AAD55473.1 [hydrothermal vent metagenome]|uniref:Gb/AAD55473.1 n=1 Tax=hydrothermal vent metagenome TaxID=652676 RepID=A0A3B0Z5W3_9ZZZZ
MSELSGIHHVSVLVADLERSLEFYGGLLGLAIDGSRPDIGFPGAWLQVGDQQIHLLQLPDPDPLKDRPAHAGRDRHAAFSVTDLQVLEGRLSAAEISFTRSRSGRRAVFCRDPDGNGIELVEVV